MRNVPIIASWTGLLALAAGAASAQATPEASEVVAAPMVYPAESLALREQGRVGYRAEYDRRGEANSCEVTRSSGYERLDQATCRLILTAGRLKRGANGRRQRRYDGTVNWKLP